MNNQSRTSNSIRNFAFGLGGRILQYLLSFATRTVFIMFLSVEYLGVNGLFTNVLAVLSLAEMGVGGAIVSLLYRPLYEQDTEKLKSLMQAYKKAYLLIGLIVAAAGLAMYPFLHIFVKDSSIENINLIYFMFLAGSVASYFYAYKIDLLVADQKEYIRTIYTQAYVILQYVLQILVLFLTRDFIIYLAIQIVSPIVGNFILANKINCLYPFLREKGLPLDRATLQELRNRVTAGIYHHFGYVIINGTDSLVISAFLGVFWVGIYSNYLLIIGVIAAFIALTFNAMVASVGNLTASSDKAKSFLVFRKLQFLNFLLIGFASVCLIALFNPFITLWIGNQYILDQKVVVIIVAMFYLGPTGMQKGIHIFKDVSGLFYYDRYYSLVEGLINIALSVYLVRHLGLAGVFLGTIAASLATRMWTEAYFVFRYLFERPLWDYYSKYFQYGLATVLTAVLVYYGTRLIPHDDWGGFLIMALTVAVSTILIFTVCFFRTEEYHFFYKFARRKN